jgi:four helix bundle protein
VVSGRWSVVSAGLTMSVQSYRDLIAWQKAIDFAEAVHRATRAFPREEMFGLTSQLRRATVSIASNIAEGQGRGTTRDFVHFLRTSHGSMQEAETQIILAERFGYITSETARHLLNQSAELGRLNYGLIRSLNRRKT